MKKEKMVTRTAEVNTYDVMMVNVLTAEVEKTDVDIYSISNEAEALKIIKRDYETDENKVVTCKLRETREVLFGMPESQFYANAIILPSRSGKNTEV